MAQIRQAFLVTVLAGAFWAAAGSGPKFAPDDPLQAMPPPIPLPAIPATSKVGENLDFFAQSVRMEPRPPTPADAINTLGEVPDSEWFTNRHGRHRMTRDELQRGPDFGKPPSGPFTVTGGKSEGITPGLRMKDAAGRTYFVKGDPPDSSEMATAVDVIVSNFLYAIGYNTPKNDILDLKLADLKLSNTAKLTVEDKRKRRMNWGDVKQVVKQLNLRPDGSFRIVASLAIEGQNVGPFRFEGTRPDDPNDITPHENRRDLRGLYVFSAWLNNTDIKPGNTLDTVVEPNGTRFIRHYLLDFGSALGSDGDRPKDARFGNEYILATPVEALARIFTLGLVPAPWETAHYPDLPAVGRFESRLFDPDRWKPDYPVPAFLSRLPEDDFWAAKQVMAFTDDDIRAVVETGKFSDPRSTDYIVATLAERRDKIGRAFFSKLLPLDHFRIEAGSLLFDDLAAEYGFHAPRQYAVRWFRFDNINNNDDPIPNAAGTRLPVEAQQAPSGSYFSAVIDAAGDPLKPVKIYLRKEGQDYRVVGLERNYSR